MFGTSEPALGSLPPYLVDNVPLIVDSISQKRLREDVINLIGPHNRLHAQEAMRKAEDYIVTSFQDAGWQTQRRPYTVKNVKGNLDYGRFEPTTYPELSGANITALKPGTESTDTLVIEAHYDTIKMSPGADDNIASVAALLELARVLQPYSFKHSVMLAACDMEEIGFIGATQLVKELKAECKVRGAIIFETMAYTSKKPNSQSVPPGFEKIYPSQYKRLKARGFTGEGSLVIYHNNGKPLAVGFSESMAHVAGKDSVMMIRAPGDVPILGQILRVSAFHLIWNFYRADHYPFLKAGIPAIQITDSANFRNPHYHRLTDKPDTLDYDHLVNVVTATALIILHND